MLVYYGKINNKDITIVKRLANQTGWTELKLGVTDNSGNDGKIANKEITLIKRASNGTSLGW